MIADDDPMVAQLCAACTRVTHSRRNGRQDTTKVVTVQWLVSLVRRLRGDPENLRLWNEAVGLATDLGFVLHRAPEGRFFVVKSNGDRIEVKPVAVDGTVP